MPMEPPPIVEILPATAQQEARMADAIIILSAWLLRLHEARTRALPAPPESAEEGP